MDRLVNVTDKSVFCCAAKSKTTGSTVGVSVGNGVLVKVGVSGVLVGVSVGNGVLVNVGVSGVLVGVTGV